MKLYIPAVGTELTLAKDWTFQVVNETRNKTLVEWMTQTPIKGWGMHPLGDVNDEQGRRDYWATAKLTIPCTLPAGTVLKIDRIYLRKGNKDIHNYDSVTFVCKGLRAPSTVYAYGVKQVDGSHYYSKLANRAVRFFAKLDDVNTMEIV